MLSVGDKRYISHKEHLSHAIMMNLTIDYVKKKKKKKSPQILLISKFVIFILKVISTQTGGAKKIIEK